MVISEPPPSSSLSELDNVDTTDDDDGSSIRSTSSFLGEMTNISFHLFWVLDDRKRARMIFWTQRGTDLPFPLLLTISLMVHVDDARAIFLNKKWNAFAVIIFFAI